MRSFVTVLALLALCSCTPAIPQGYVPEAGDVVFQSLPHAELVDMIEGATKSPFSHCGIVVNGRDGWAVLEAIGTVHETPLEEWIARGRQGAFASYRWNSLETKDISAIVAAAQKQSGRSYDFHYDFDNEEVYCSELIYVAYREVLGRTVGSTVQVKELDWKPFETFIKELEGGDVPLDRKLITPQALADAPELTLIFSQGFAEVTARQK